MGFTEYLPAIYWIMGKTIDRVTHDYGAMVGGVFVLIILLVCLIFGAMFYTITILREELRNKSEHTRELEQLLLKDRQSTSKEKH